MSLIYKVYFFEIFSAKNHFFIKKILFFVYLDKFLKIIKILKKIYFQFFL